MARPAVLLLESILGLVAGLVLAFGGYRLARSLAGLAGFLSGFVLGLILGIVVGPIGALVFALLLGVVFALLFALAFRLAGGALGLGLGIALGSAMGWPAWAVALAAVVGIIVGIAANKPMIVGATALVGAWLAVESGAELLQDAGVRAFEPPWILVATIALALVGATVQWRGLRGED